MATVVIETHDSEINSFNLQVYFKGPDHLTLCLSNMDSHVSIDDVKFLIFCFRKIPITNQIIKYGHDIMENNKTLGDYIKSYQYLDNSNEPIYFEAINLELICI